MRSPPLRATPSPCECVSPTTPLACGACPGDSPHESGVRSHTLHPACERLRRDGSLSLSRMILVCPMIGYVANHNLRELGHNLLRLHNMRTDHAYDGTIHAQDGRAFITNAAEVHNYQRNISLCMCSMLTGSSTPGDILRALRPVWHMIQHVLHDLLMGRRSKVSCTARTLRFLFAFTSYALVSFPLRCHIHIHLSPSRAALAIPHWIRRTHLQLHPLFPRSTLSS